MAGASFQGFCGMQDAPASRRSVRVFSPRSRLPSVAPLRSRECEPNAPAELRGRGHPSSTSPSETWKFEAGKAPRGPLRDESRDLHGVRTQKGPPASLKHQEEAALGRKPSVDLTVRHRRTRYGKHRDGPQVVQGLSAPASSTTVRHGSLLSGGPSSGPSAATGCYTAHCTVVP